MLPTRSGAPFAPQGMRGGQNYAQKWTGNGMAPPPGFGAPFGAPGPMHAPGMPMAHGAPPMMPGVPPPIAAMRRPDGAPQAVSIQHPTLVSSFSYDESKMLCFDDRSKRYYHAPPTQQNHGNGSGAAADLNYGFESFHEKPHVPDPLDSVLYTLMHRASQPTPPPPVHGAAQVPAEALEAELLRTNVITWRGILTKLCTAWACHVQAPPMFREGFELNVMMLGDTLIIEETPPDMHQLAALAQQSKPRKLQKATYYGYNFESFCTANTPDGPSAPNGWGGPVNTNEQWCHIVKTRLGDTRVMIGGEVDCVESPNHGAPETVVELKTNMQPRNEQDQLKLQVKMLRMYMQSFLLGVQSIVVGFRDHKGTLLSHEQYRTTDLPRMVRGKPGQWNAHHNLSFGAQVLEWLRKEVGREMERWSFHVAQSLKQNEAVRGPYPWRVHRTTQSFLGHLPLPSVEDAEMDYPVYRVSFQPPFQQVTLRYVPPAELQRDGRRAHRCGLVPSAFYRWATSPMPTV